VCNLIKAYILLDHLTCALYHALDNVSKELKTGNAAGPDSLGGESLKDADKVAT
jgi:hypothetical protein